MQSTSSIRRLCDYYVSPAPCKPLSGGARPLDGSSGTGPLMNQSKPKHLLERRDKDGSLRERRFFLNLEFDSIRITSEEGCSYQWSNLPGINRPFCPFPLG
uniref:Uncharacterized protein n=1 Tax=Utricularia reniformis TaxID=192314 RepID=A0A1Y0B2M5_9LAMI|nr:hypothetical protein AEK19_MT1453 [Utricularia reniformis]ART31644.1 hypothetical protein AEK19_MT1453 [Utricularia reniformis]